MRQGYARLARRPASFDCRPYQKRDGSFAHTRAGPLADPRGATRRTPVSRLPSPVYRCTSAHATSPTIFNDPAESLSIVSSGV